MACCKTLQANVGLDTDGGVLQPDGKLLYLNEATGKFETLEQKEARLQHNCKMRFHRSLQSAEADIYSSPI